ncbi:MAG: 23S rRNA pseudouridine(2604) synthase RluF [Bacteroidetes bacterium]|nr:23S rRNA pseudouridine(2604) synthase RluF [Bacteroidota bacterium]
MMEEEQLENKNDGIQINKFVSNSGYCSRREADKLVEEGRVTINGNVALASNRVKRGDKVAVDDEYIKNKKSDFLYIVFNKPTGITSTTDPSDKSNIIYFINHPKRIFPIGRLDKDSEGLILLTDDGDIVNKILRAGNRHEKEYVVTVDKPITGDFLRNMSNGVKILETITQPCRIRQVGNKKFHIILTQGLNRQIRRMCEALHYKVESLKRIRIMHISLENLPVGKWRKLLPQELAELNDKIEFSGKTEDASIKKEYVKKTKDQPFSKPDKKPKENNTSNRDKKSKKTTAYSSYKKNGKKGK